MVTKDEILDLFKKQNTRISKLEKKVDSLSIAKIEEDSQIIKDVKVEDEDSDLYEKIGPPVEEEVESIFSKITFNQVITFLGVTGIIIGIISFFFYAVANNWIGEVGQIMIGITLGFVLFGVGYMLRDKNVLWSNIVLGGSYFIQYLSIGIGVLEFKVLTPLFGLGLCFIFLISSLFLSLKFNSRMITYFSLVGGYLIPFISGTFDNDLFVLGLYLFLSLGLIVISFKENWVDIRSSSYCILILFLLSSWDNFYSAEVKFIGITFICLVFIMYKISSIVAFLKNTEDGGGNILDSMILISLPIFFLGYLYSLIDWDNEFFGIFVMLFSFVYLVEFYYFGLKKTDNLKVLTHTLFSTGVIAINLGLMFLFNTLNWDFFIILFAIEWFLFSILSKKVNNNFFYSLFSYVFLGLSIILYLFVLRFNDGLLHGSFFMLFLIAFVYAFYYLFNKSINYTLNAAGFIISGFVVIYSLIQYLVFFGIDGALGEICLSILWLVYTLFMFSHVETTNGKVLVGLLLAFTLCKIAFNDLFYLDGAFKILGFILFGILLLIGGYFIKNDSK